VSIVYGLLIADVAIMYARTARLGGALGAFAARRRNEFALATLPMFAAALVTDPTRYVLWSIALAIIMLPALGYRFGHRSGEVGFDEHHLVERLGLLTIIVCGESFVKVSLLAADGSFEDLDVVVLGALFILVFSMWWSYFDDVPAAGLPASPARMRGWLVGHLLLQVCLVGIAVGFAKLLPLEFGDAVDGDRVLLGAGPLVGVYLALALVGACTRRVPIRPLLLLRLGSAAFVAAVGVAIWRVTWIDVEAAASLLALVALVHGGLSARLRRGTRVVEAPLAAR
jgi:low temperature requirement protein LtrA